MGGRLEADTSRDADEIVAIRAAIAAGITHIDTAEHYGNGHAEELLGRAIQDYDRQKLCIASKVWPTNQSYDGVLRACEQSLRRIGTNYLDIYLLHFYPAAGLPIAETMKAMDKLVDQGIVKNIGVCNLSPRRFDEVQKYTANKLVCNQLHYNVQYREVESRGLLPYMRHKDSLLVAYRPVQKGTLPIAPILIELAKKYQKTPIQIAINWLVSQDQVVTICKTSSLSHLQENLGAVDWTMEPADVERIRKEFPDQKTVSDSVPLDYEADIPV